MLGHQATFKGKFYFYFFFTCLIGWLQGRLDHPKSSREVDEEFGEGLTEPADGWNSMLRTLELAIAAGPLVLFKRRKLSTVRISRIKLAKVSGSLPQAGYFSYRVFSSGCKGEGPGIPQSGLRKRSFGRALSRLLKVPPLNLGFRRFWRWLARWPQATNALALLREAGMICKVRSVIFSMATLSSSFRHHLGKIKRGSRGYFGAIPDAFTYDGGSFNIHTTIPTPVPTNSILSRT